jgi:acetyl esterase/lipase
MTDRLRGANSTQSTSHVEQLPQRVWLEILSWSRSRHAERVLVCGARAPKKLGGPPPAWIGVDDIDLFCEEDTLCAERLAASGMNVALEFVADAPNGFEAWASGTAISQAYVDGARRWPSRQYGRGHRE